MSFEEYDQLAEFLGIEPETKGETIFFEKIWEYMDKNVKQKVKGIEL